MCILENNITSLDKRKSEKSENKNDIPHNIHQIEGGGPNGLSNSLGEMALKSELMLSLLLVIYMIYMALKFECFEFFENFWILNRKFDEDTSTTYYC